MDNLGLSLASFEDQKASVVFLFTDIVGSSRRMEREPEQMYLALSRYDELVGSIVESHGGMVVRPRGNGDSHFCVFRQATSAVAASVELLYNLERESWPLESPLQVRVGLHEGGARIIDRDFYGPAVNLAAKVRDIARPSQILVTEPIWRELFRDPIPDVALVARGKHLLPGLDTEAELWQVRSDRFEFVDVLPNSLSTIPTNLRHDPTSFVERVSASDGVSDVQRLVRLVEGHRVVTVLGPAGIGKSRIARRAASALMAQFPDGIFSLDFLSSQEPADRIRQIATYLEVQLPSKPSMHDLGLSLRDKRCLLILENCESDLDFSRNLATLLVTVAKQSGVICTTNVPIQILEEAILRVGPLGLPTSNCSSLGDLTDSPTGELIVSRLQSKSVEIVDDPLTVQKLAELCVLSSGNPLAVELIAASCATIGLANYYESILVDPLAHHGAQTSPQVKHRSIRDLFAYNLSLVEDHHRPCLHLLANLPGGMSVDDLSYHLNLPTVAVNVTVEKLAGLLLITELATKGSARRVRLTDLARRLANESLSRSEIAQAIRSGLLRGFAFNAEKLASDRQSLHRFLFEEAMNIRFLLESVVAHQFVAHLDIERLCHLVSCFTRHAYLFGGPMFARAFQQKLISDSFVVSASARRDLSVACGLEMLRDGSPQEAVHQLSLAIAEFEGFEDGVAFATALNAYGLALQACHEYEKSLSILEQAKVASETVGDEELLAVIMSNLGIAHRELGDLQIALQHHQEAEELREEFNDLAGLGISKVNQGLVLQDLGDFRKALACYQVGGAMLRDQHCYSAAITAQYNECLCLVLLGDLVNARETLWRSFTETEHQIPEFAVDQLVILACLGLASEDQESVERVALSRQRLPSWRERVPTAASRLIDRFLRRGSLPGATWLSEFRERMEGCPVDLRHDLDLVCSALEEPA